MNNKKFITYEEYLGDLDLYCVECKDPNANYVLVAEQDFYCRGNLIKKGTVGGFFYSEQEDILTSDSWVDVGSIIGLCVIIKNNCYIDGKSDIFGKVHISNSEIKLSTISNHDLYDPSWLVIDSCIICESYIYNRSNSKSCILNTNIDHSKLSVNADDNINIYSSNIIYSHVIAWNMSYIRINKCSIYNSSAAIYSEDVVARFNISDIRLHDVYIDNSHKLYVQYLCLDSSPNKPYKFMKRFIGYNKLADEYDIVSTGTVTHDNNYMRNKLIDCLTLQEVNNSEDKIVNLINKVGGKHIYHLDHVLYINKDIVYEPYGVEEYGLSKYLLHGDGKSLIPGIDPMVAITINSSLNPCDGKYNDCIEEFYERYAISDTEDLIFAAKLKGIDKIMIVLKNKFLDKTTVITHKFND